MSAAPVLRRAVMADAERLAGMHAACFEDVWDRAAFEAFLARANTVIFIAADGSGGPMAFIVVQIASDECEILSLATLPAVRRAGLGSALVHASAGAAVAAGAHRMFLEVAQDNEAARALYSALGFVPAGRRRNYYRSQVGKVMDALILRASLPLTR